MTKLNSNWQVFPYSDDSVVNLRFLRTDFDLPAVSKIFRRSTYKTDSDFEDAILNEALAGNQLGYNVYQCLNPINYDFKGKAVTDGDIFCVDNLFLDIDRVGNKALPASDEELEKGWMHTSTLLDFLLTQGWPAPTIVMSGSGYHVYFGLDEDALEPTEDNKILRRVVVKCLAKAFDSSLYELDQGVYNESRLTKVIGTMAYKGEESDRRPYRRVRLISERSNYCFVTDSMMRDLIETLGGNVEGELQSFSAPDQRITTEPETPRNIARLVDALKYISADCHHDTWYRIIWAILSTGWSCAEDIGQDWSLSAPERYEELGLLLKIDTFNPQHKEQITLGTAFHHAKAGGWNG